MLNLGNDGARGVDLSHDPAKMVREDPPKAGELAERVFCHELCNIKSRCF
jgi:hypothetical protein